MSDETRDPLEARNVNPREIDTKLTDRTPDPLEAVAREIAAELLLPYYPMDEIDVRKTLRIMRRHGLRSDRCDCANRKEKDDGR